MKIISDDVRGGVASMWCFHRWTKAELIELGIGMFEYRRKCEKCGAERIKVGNAFNSPLNNEK